MTAGVAGRLLVGVLGPHLEERARSTAPEVERYRRDPFAHVDDGHVWLLDLETRQPAAIRPWPHQKELTAAWIDLDLLATTGELRFRNVHEEKSRQMGMTTWEAYLVWWLLNHHEAPGGIVHDKLGDIADPGLTPDSFFGKIKFIHEHRLPTSTPGEPGPFAIPAHLRAPLRFTGGSTPIIRNPERKFSFISGTGRTPDPARGGTYAYFILEEAARLAWSEQVQASVTRAVPEGRLYVSTPHGKDNTYYRLREERPEGYVFLRHHWSTHPVYGRGAHVAAYRPEVGDDGRELPGEHAIQPNDDAALAANSCRACAGTILGVLWNPIDPGGAHRYPGKLTSPWYDFAVVELTDEQVAEELDIDYAASLPGRVYPEFSVEQHVLPSIPFEPMLPLSFAWDYGLDTTAVAILQESPYELRQIGELELGDSVPEEVCRALRARLRELGVGEVELQAQFTLQLLGVGDPAGEGRSLATGRPLTADYRAAGFSIVSPPTMNVATTIRAVKRLLMGRPKPYRASAATCPLTISHFEANRWPTDSAGRVKLGAKAPLDDRHNHMMRALAYYVTYRFPPPSAQGSITTATEKAADRTGRVDPSISYDMRL